MKNKTAAAILSKHTQLTIDEEAYRIQTKVSYVLAAMEEYAAQFEQKWLRVSDSPMPERERVLAFFERSGKIGIAYRDRTLCYYDSGYEAKGLTHWQPLPNRPITNP